MKVRLPIEYRMKDAKREIFELAAEEKARRMFRDYDSYTTDIVIMANVIALVENEKWGTGKRATKIPRHIASVERTIREVCDRYEPAFAMTALQMKLDQYGIKYERKNGND